MRNPLVFENYNTEGCMGFGLKTLGNINIGDVLVRMKTEMGLVSTSFIDDMTDDNNAEAS